MLFRAPFLRGDDGLQDSIVFSRLVFQARSIARPYRLSAKLIVERGYRELSSMAPKSINIEK